MDQASKAVLCGVREEAMTLLTRLDKRLAAVFERASAWLVEDTAEIAC